MSVSMVVYSFTFIASIPNFECLGHIDDTIRQDAIENDINAGGGSLKHDAQWLSPSGSGRETVWTSAGPGSQVE
ncbi:unnamed protein product, partial [Amoebophrya sp. A25]|eukprot:GSA25T00018792001.1